MTLRRFTWIIAVLLLVGAIAATAVIVYRDSIGREIVNAVLKDSDYAVSGLSVESLSKDQVTLSVLTVEHVDGLQLVVEGITLPVNIRERRIRSLSIEAVEIVPAETDTGEAPYSELFQTGLRAHELVPGITVEVGELVLPWFPDLLEVEWRTSQNGQTVRFNVDDFTVEARAERQDDGYQVVGSAITFGGARALAMSGTAGQDDGDTLVVVDMDIGLDHWLPALHALGTVPDGLESLSGEVNGQVEVRLPAAPAGDVSTTAVAGSDQGISLSYRSDGGTIVDVTTSALESVGLQLGYPSLDWQARVSAMRARVVALGEEPIGLTLNDVNCRSGIECRVDVVYEGRKLSDEGWSIGRLGVSVPIEVQVAEEVRFESRSPASIQLDDVSLDDWSLATISLIGELAGEGEQYRAKMEIAAGEGIGGRLSVAFDAGRSEGSVRLEEGLVDFSVRNASSVFRNWNYAWDVVSGTVAAAAAVEWQSGGEEPGYSGDVKVTLDDLAGVYHDMAFAGLSMATVATVRAGEPIGLEPFDVAMSLCEIGFPVENIGARVVPDLDGGKLAVSDVQMDTLGGRLTVDPFEYSTEADENRLVLRPEAIQLQLIVDLVDFEALMVEGSVSGEIPVAIGKKGITAEGGRVVSDAPGGAIRFPSGIPGVDSSDPASQLGMVAAALSNFEFETLTSNVDYTADGDLLLQMRMQGVNPDVDPLQPVVLNLGLENNVPELLRSLQAARSISDILDRRFAQQGVSP